MTAPLLDLDVPAVKTPTCSEGHGPMMLRTGPQSPESAWCGTWHDCTYIGPGKRCWNSHLTASPELRAFLAEQAARSTGARGDR
ncbi:hypothetical protein [Polymorphospora lycopeni]|uniref:Uncharacterized protein n=1 Tax=Polymorphospora lycopeni TaxID=3140240 RepID=A0ABV5CKN6_9ACTN